MTLRDDLLPVFQDTRGVIQDLGLRRFSVILRRRIWSGAEVGDGACVDEDIVLTPLPKVTFRSPFARQLEIQLGGGTVRDRYYQIEKITPAFNDGQGNVGGYTPDQLRMRVGPDMRNVDPVVVLLGDDGTLRECEQVLLEDDKSFGYSMLVQEADNPGVVISELAVSGITALEPGATLQLVATATYADGQQYPVTSIVKWTSDNPAVATVDLLGVITALADGVANITASLSQLASPQVALTVSG